MILVDSSVWIDYLRGASTPQTEKLDGLLGAAPLAISDLILTEVLQGCASDREFNEVRRTLESLELVHVGGADVAIQAAKNYRRLRALGITVRKTMDTIIATRCIMSRLELLHDDRDFEPFSLHLGLKCVSCET